MKEIIIDTLMSARVHFESLRSISVRGAKRSSSNSSDMTFSLMRIIELGFLKSTTILTWAFLTTLSRNSCPLWLMRCLKLFLTLFFLLKITHQFPKSVSNSFINSPPTLEFPLFEYLLPQMIKNTFQNVKQALPNRNHRQLKGQISKAKSIT
jgi:hypothetical protein